MLAYLLVSSASERLSRAMRLMILSSTSVRLQIWFTAYPQYLQDVCVFSVTKINREQHACMTLYTYFYLQQPPFQDVIGEESTEVPNVCKVVHGRATTIERHFAFLD